MKSNMNANMSNRKTSFEGRGQSAHHAPRTTPATPFNPFNSPLHVSRFTFHVSRSTLRAFTLIELIVVVSIIALLASLIFPVVGAVNRIKLKKRTQVELMQVETAIETYKSKLGHYPPDNPACHSTNSLYFELLGSVLATNTSGQAYFKTLDGTAEVLVSDLGNVFGQNGPNPNVGGIVNCTQGSGDEGHPATPFVVNLKPAQIGSIHTNGSSVAKVLACSVPWPEVTPNYYPAGVPGVNPFCYNSSNPTNNPTTYDLWVDVIIGGKTNRFCNWSADPLIVGAPQ